MYVGLFSLFIFARRKSGQMCFAMLGLQFPKKCLWFCAFRGVLVGAWSLMGVLLDWVDDLILLG